MFVLNGNSGKILGALKSCGLTEYESKAYFTLLLSGRSMVWELSRRSAVPQSKIYSVIDSLVDRGLVDVVEGKPKSAQARDFEPYAASALRVKKKEMEAIGGAADLMERTVRSLRPMIRYGRYRVFEPKYLRRRRRLT